jgi:hypothetical protein
VEFKVWTTVWITFMLYHKLGHSHIPVQVERGEWDAGEAVSGAEGGGDRAHE